MRGKSYITEENLPAMRLISIASEANWSYCILCNRWWQPYHERVTYSGMKPMMPYTGETCPRCIRAQEKQKQEAKMPKKGKLNETQKEEVRELIRQGWTDLQIADKFGVVKSTVFYHRQKMESAAKTAEKVNVEDDSSLKAWEADIDEKPETTDEIHSEYEMLKHEMESIRAQSEYFVTEVETLRAQLDNQSKISHMLTQKNKELQEKLNDREEELMRWKTSDDNEATEEAMWRYLDQKMAELESQLNAIYRVKNLIGAGK